MNDTRTNTSTPSTRRSGGLAIAPVAVVILLTGLLIAAGPRIEHSDVSPAAAGPSVAPQGEALIKTYFQDQLTALLADLTPDAEEQERLENEIRPLYEERGFRLAWVTNDPILSRARALVTFLDSAEQHGLDPARYQVTRLARDVKKLELQRFRLPKETVSLEARLTGTLLMFARDLHEGRVDATAIPAWHKEKAPVDVVALVAEALASEDEAELQKQIEPEHAGYKLLAERAVRYRALVNRGGWPAVPEGDALEIGSEVASDRLAALVARLQVEGDLAPDWTPQDAVYDETLAAAVESFQQRYGLDVDGKLGADTIAAMNVPAAERLWQIEANLERWRWLPAELPADRIDVNVPSFELRGYRDHRVEVEMAVAVGKPSWATPIFEDEVLYAETNPYWNVPESIAADEILPALRKNPNYLREENMEIVRGWAADGNEPVRVDWNDPDGYGPQWRIRQRPGSGNALGKIKFIFPNPHGVYLHDTPAQRAFQRASRAVSHGCIRVAEPMALAAFLLGDGTYYREVEPLLASGRQERVDLRRPMPVMIHYWTAFADDAGRMNFRDDLYGLDKVLAERLAEETARFTPLPEPATRVADGGSEADYQRALKPRVST